MNTKIYKQVHGLAIELIKAAKKEDEARFIPLYEELKALCELNEGDEVKNHPVQWEALADFTEDLHEAIAYYEKALAYAEAIQANDYMSSIGYSMATLLKEVNQPEKAITCAHRADEAAAKSCDDELQQEIKDLLKSLGEEAC